MKWKEKTAFYKIVDVVAILSAVAFLVLAVLNVMGVGAHESLSRFCFAIGWLCMGVSHWKTNRTLGIIECCLSAGWFLFALILLF